MAAKRRKSQDVLLVGGSELKNIQESMKTQRLTEQQKLQSAAADNFFPELRALAKEFFAHNLETEKHKTRRFELQIASESRSTIGVLGAAFVFALTALGVTAWTGQESYIITVVSSFFSFLGGFGFGRARISGAAVPTNEKAD